MIYKRSVVLSPTVFVEGDCVFNNKPVELIATSNLYKLLKPKSPLLPERAWV